MSINDVIYDIILVGHLSCTAVQHVTIKGYILALGVAHGQCKPSFYSNLFLPTCVLLSILFTILITPSSPFFGQQSFLHFTARAGNRSLCWYLCWQCSSHPDS